MIHRNRVLIRKRWWVAVVCSSVLLASCKGGDTKVNASATTVSTSQATSTVLPTSDPAKVAKAQAAVLQAADFPPGWGTQPEDAGLNIETVWRDVLRCLAVKQGPTLALGTSATYLQGIATQVRSTVEYTTDAAASAYAAALASPNAVKCLTDAFVADVNRSKPEGSTPGAVQVTPRDYQQFGQKTLAWRIDASVDLGGLQVPLSQDFVVIFNGGTVIRLFFLNPGGEFAPNLERSLVQDVVARA